MYEIPEKDSGSITHACRHPATPPPFQAETKPLMDPVLAQDRERSEEDRVVFRCSTGAVLSDKALAQLHLPPLPLAPLGRHGTECNTWIEMPLGDIESPVRIASRYQSLYLNCMN